MSEKGESQDYEYRAEYLYARAGESGLLQDASLGKKSVMAVISYGAATAVFLLYLKRLRLRGLAYVGGCFCQPAEKKRRKNGGKKRRRKTAVRKQQRKTAERKWNGQI